MGRTLSWDRGTLLFGNGDRGVDCAVWDDRVGRWRAPAWRYAALHRQAAVDSVFPRLPGPARVAVPELRPYQREALAAWQAAGRRGTISLPTGAGKTRTAAAAIAECGLRSLVLAPTNVLVHQWVGVLQAAGFGLVGRFAEGIRDEQPITVATFAAARVHMERLGNRYGLLVVDEVHHFGGGAGDEVLEQCAAPARLGLTATPNDGDRATRLDAIVGPIAYRVGIDALTGQWLARLDVRRWLLNLDPNERAAYDADIDVFQPFCRAWFRASPGADWAEFTRIARRTEDGRAALAAWRRSRAIVAFPTAKRRALGELLTQQADRRVLVFTADTAGAFAVAREHLVPVVTAAIGAAERTQILARFEAGDWPVIVSARVLNEGLDVPGAETAIVVGGAQGSREYVQRVGRILRPAIGKTAVVYDLVMRDTFEVAKANARQEALHG